MPESTVLGKKVPNDQFVHLVANAIRDRAELARQAMGTPYASPSAPRHVAALESLADYLVGLSPDDQRVRALYEIRAFHGDTDQRAPGPDVQAQFLTTIGDGTHVPQPNESLNEFVAAGIEDLRRLFSSLRGKLTTAQKRAADFDDLQGELREATEKVASLKDELREARADANNLREQRDYLRARRSDDVSSEPAASVLSSSSGDGLARDESDQKEKTHA